MKNDIYSGGIRAPRRFLSRVVRRCSALLLLSAALAPRMSAQLTEKETDAAIYFNAATEKYIQGDLESAASNAERAVALEPDNAKVAEFAARIFYEGAQDAHNARDYKKALVYLERARAYNPSDARIANLYEVTKNIMERAAPPAPSPKTTTPPPARPPAAKPSGAPAQPETAAESAKAVGAERTMSAYAVERAAAILLSVSFAGFLIVGIIIVSRFRSRIKKYELKAVASAEENEKLKKDASERGVEIGRLKEALKYEQESSARVIKELKEEKAIKNRQFEEQLRVGLDIRHRQLEEILKGGALSASNSPMAAVHGSRAKVLESIGDATHIDEDSSVALEAARERIANQARELYSVSPNGCMTFLREMASNPNPLIRANIAKALSSMATGGTLEILVGLWRDSSPKVRREALRELKKLRDNLRRGAVSLDDKSAAALSEAVSDALASGDWVF